MSPNPIISLLQPANPLAGIFNMFRAASNPMQLLQSMAMNDPRMQTALDMINQNGGNAKQAFYAEARNKGADPSEVLRQAQSMMR